MWAPSKEKIICYFHFYLVEKKSGDRQKQKKWGLRKPFFYFIFSMREKIGFPVDSVFGV